MCLQLNDPVLKSTFDVVLTNLPAVPELPACLQASARFELERARLIEAELCLRAATRHAEQARWCDLDAAIQLAEQQISLPLQKLLWADERHTEETDAAILPGEEVEAMSCFIDEVVACRRERRFPCFDREDAVLLGRLLTKYAAAIAEKRERCDDAASADDHDFWHVRQHLLAANSSNPASR